MKKGRLGTVTVLTMSASSQQTAAFGAYTNMIRIATAGQAAYFLVGADPTAAATSHVLGANCVDYIVVAPGQKCAVLQGGTAGSISITEIV